MELANPEESLIEGSRVRLVWSHKPLMVKIRSAAKYVAVN